MRLAVRSVVAVCLTTLLAACADSPAAPEPSPADRLAAIADSARAAGDPMASLFLGASAMVGRGPAAKSVTIEVDGKATVFQAVVLESLIPLPSTSCVGGPQLCSTAPVATDSRTLLAWDADMRRFVQVSVIERALDDALPVGALATYGERGVGRQPGRWFWGTATAPQSRVGTGSACPSRRDAIGGAIASCVTAVYDFAFSFSAEPIGALSGLFADPFAGPAPATSAAHTLRMATTRLPGVFVTFASVPGGLPGQPFVPILPVRP